MFKKVLITLLILAAFPLWAAPPLHHASGGGFFVLHSGSGDYDVMFAFNARQLSEDGSAQGQFEQHNLSMVALCIWRLSIWSSSVAIMFVCSD
jgi:hypothetical protein